MGDRYTSLNTAWLSLNIPATHDLRQGQLELLRLGPDLPGAKLALKSFPKIPIGDQLQHEYSLALDQRLYADQIKQIWAAANSTQPGSADGVELNCQLIRALATVERGAM